MSGVIKYPTNQLSISPEKRNKSKARIWQADFSKKDYLSVPSFYNRVCVVGKKEWFYQLVEEQR